MRTYKGIKSSLQFNSNQQKLDISVQITQTKDEKDERIKGKMQIIITKNALYILLTLVIFTNFLTLSNCKETSLLDQLSFPNEFIEKNQEIFVKLQGQVYYNIISNKSQQMMKHNRQCMYQLIIGSKTASLRLSCYNKNDKKTSEEVDLTEQIWKFNVIEVLSQQTYKSHLYQFKMDTTNSTNSNNDSSAGQTLRIRQVKNQSYLKAQNKFGVQWSYKLAVDIEESIPVSNMGRINSRSLIDGMLVIQGKLNTNELAIAYLFIFYTVISFIIIPPFKVYYQYMYGINIYSMIISLLMDLFVGVNIGTVLIIYFRNIRLYFSTSDQEKQTDISISEAILVFACLIICLISVIIHFIRKSNTFLVQTKIQYQKTQNLVIIICFLLLILSLAKYTKMHKDVSTFVFLATGPIYYMCTIFIFEYMKKYYFSFRLVAYQAIQILILAVGTKIYPILYYQILNSYRLIACLLIVVALLITAFIIYILINILRKDQNLIKQRQKRVEKGSSISSVLGQENLQQYNEHNKQGWGKMKQQSIVSQAENQLKSSSMKEVQLKQNETL